MDWKELLARLKRAGLTQTQIAERCGGVAQSTISALARGETKSPDFGLGAALQKLDAEVAALEADGPTNDNGAPPPAGAAVVHARQGA